MSSSLAWIWSHKLLFLSNSFHPSDANIILCCLGFFYISDNLIFHWFIALMSSFQYIQYQIWKIDCETSQHFSIYWNPARSFVVKNKPVVVLCHWGKEGKKFLGGQAKKQQLQCFSFSPHQAASKISYP